MDSSGDDQAPVEERLREAGELLLTRLASGAYDAAHESFDPRLQDLLPVTQLREAWRSLGDGEPVVRAVEVDPDERHVSVTFDRAEETHRMDLTFDGTAPTTILFNDADDPRPTEYRYPPYTSGDLRSEGVSLEAGDRSLYGEVVFPDATPDAGVVIVPGSGTTDMDGKRGTARPYRDLAYGLAAEGIVTLRYNKRPVVDAGSIEERLVTDATTAVEALVGLDSASLDDVHLLGHSLGGFAAPLVYDACERLSRMVVLGAPSGDLLSSAIDQTGLDATSDRLRTMIDDGDPSSVLGFPPTFWRGIESYDPVQMVNELDCRVFVCHAAQDEKVDDASVEHWRRRTDGQTTVRSYDGLDHCFLPAPEAESSSESSQRHVARTVVADVAEWLMDCS